jgi:hypothetical protein
MRGELVVAAVALLDEATPLVDPPPSCAGSCSPPVAPFRRRRNEQSWPPA